jgi:hypothetical protein
LQQTIFFKIKIKIIMSTAIPINKENIKSVTFEENGSANILDDKGTKIAGFTAKKENGKALVTYSGVKGATVNVQFTISEDNNGDFIVNGSVNGSPASLTATSQGVITKQNPPAKKVEVDPNDILIFKSIVDYQKMIKDAGNPPPFNPKTEEKIKAGVGTGTVINPPIASPLSVGCALAIVGLAIVFLGAAAVTGGVGAGLALAGAAHGGFSVGWECLR